MFGVCVLVGLCKMKDQKVRRDKKDDQMPMIG